MKPFLCRLFLFLLAAVLVILLLLPACSGIGSRLGLGQSREEQEARAREKAAAVLSQPFESVASIEYQGVKARMTIDRAASGSCRLEFLEPASLSGVVFETEGDLLRLSYGSARLEMTTEEFFSSSAVRLLLSAINSATSPQGIELSMEDGCILVSGVNENGTFSLLLDPDNGNVLALELPSLPLKVEFENFSFLS